MLVKRKRQRSDCSSTSPSFCLLNSGPLLALGGPGWELHLLCLVPSPHCCSHSRENCRMWARSPYLLAGLSFPQPQLRLHSWWDDRTDGGASFVGRPEGGESSMCGWAGERRLCWRYKKAVGNPSLLVTELFQNVPWLPSKCVTVQHFRYMCFSGERAVQLSSDPQRILLSPQKVYENH